MSNVRFVSNLIRVVIVIGVPMVSERKVLTHMGEKESEIREVLKLYARE